MSKNFQVVLNVRSGFSSKALHSIYLVNFFELRSPLDKLFSDRSLFVNK